ncbi:hypothetical protein [Yersinia mollaretii]|uniref:hypothetical protein n=1 Tax=Yersinia mollaretii TaxID=33060 RepID=UPI001FCA5ECC|nr:hypothetical protein [Yersinia mollaretii]MDA5535794.1 hypothetical protein [Yersinia mollaretii]
MHRIDTPTAQVDKFGAGKNGFTRGNPQTGVPATALDDDYFDAIQEEIAGVVESTGVVLDKSNRTQLLTALKKLFLRTSNNFSEIAAAGSAAVTAALANLGLSDVAHLPQLTGVIGTSRNAKMSVTAASATATFTADELIVQESLGGRQYKLTSFNKTINLATIGAGGMDTGTAPVTGFVALYAIYNPTTQVSALLAVNATSVLAPEVYGGANMPANYTASALVSVWATTAARLLNIGFQRGRKINIPRIVVITTTTPPSTATSLSLATAVPKNAIEVSGYASIAGASLNSSIIVLSANSNAAGLIQVSAAFSATTNQNIGTFAMTLDVPQAIYWNYSQAGGTLDNTGLSVSTYTF